jgi:NAD(P)-dependent dehydrogenase (short-subunit alcohol dehydrogenase family)
LALVVREESETHASFNPEGTGGGLVKLQDRVALIIGGASGLGRASALACAQEGAKVMIADVAEEGARQVVSGIDADGGSAAFISTDITDEAAVRRAVESTVQRFGRLDILVTSAGGGTADDDEAWHFAIDIYLKGPFYACKYAVAEMERTGGGAIVNISSIAGVTGGIFGSVEQTGYPCAKHGVIGLTRTIALGYANRNIRANAVCPGYIRTGMTRALYDTPDGGQSLIQETLRVPLGRWGEAEEIGKVVAFLVSDDASYITGQPIIVDGGIMAR